MKEWHKYKDEPQRRKLHFMPQRYNSLREVPAYSRYIRERFLRCLDLYLCPRAKRMKLTIDAEYLIPKLPSPKDLQPFPTVESMVFNGHTDMIRTISVEPNGEYLVSGSDDTTVKSKYIFIANWFYFLIDSCFSLGNSNGSLHQDHRNWRDCPLSCLVSERQDLADCHCIRSASDSNQSEGGRQNASEEDRWHFVRGTQDRWNRWVTTWNICIYQM